MDAPSIYPVASLHLPGPSPTRQSAGIQGRVAGIVSRLAGPDAAGAVHVRRQRAASCNAFPASIVAAGSPAALAVSSRNAAHHNPDSGSGLAPATPAQGCCCGCQLAAANSSRSSATSWSEGGPSSPDPRLFSARLPYRTAALANCARARVCAFRSSGKLAVVIGLLRAPYSFPNLMIFSPILPTDVNCLLIRHRNCPPRAWGCAWRQGRF